MMLSHKFIATYICVRQCGLHCYKLCPTLHGSIFIWYIFAVIFIHSPILNCNVLIVSVRSNTVVMELCYKGFHPLRTTCRLTMYKLKYTLMYSCSILLFTLKDIYGYSMRDVMLHRWVSLTNSIHILRPIILLVQQLLTVHFFLRTNFLNSSSCLL